MKPGFIPNFYLIFSISLLVAACGGAGGGSDDGVVAAGSDAICRVSPSTALRSGVMVEVADADWTYMDGNFAEEFGSGWHSITSGDVNGDGFSDLVVGASSKHNPAAFDNDEGGVLLFFGSINGYAAAPDWSYLFTTQERHGGDSVDVADVNGDGFDDIAVGAQGGGSDGGAFLFLGSTGLPVASPSWQNIQSLGDFFGAPPADWIGDIAHVTLADFNGDGYADLAGRGVYYPSGQTVGSYRSVAVYYGSAGGLSSVADWHSGEFAGNDTELYSTLANAGDINNDGFDDLIINGINGFNDAVHVYLGGAVPAAQPSATLRPDEGVNAQNLNNARFGETLDRAGDVNGDGFDDIIVGSRTYDYTQFSRSDGKAFVYYGSASGPASTADWVTPQVDFARLGSDVGFAGDLNGDGYDDIYVGGTSDEWGVYHGSNSGPSAESVDYGEPTTGSGFRYSLGDAGDLDGDGYDDFIVNILESSDLGVVMFLGSVVGIADGSTGGSDSGNDSGSGSDSGSGTGSDSDSGSGSGGGSGSCTAGSDTGSGSDLGTGTGGDSGSGSGSSNQLDNEPNDSTFSPQTILPGILNGAVNNASDPNDYFSFTAASTENVTVSLSGFGSNDLDLHFLSADGLTVLDSADSLFDTTESVQVAVTAGTTYQILVSGFDTAGAVSDYTLTVTASSSGSNGSSGSGSVSYYKTWELTPPTGNGNLWLVIKSDDSVVRCSINISAVSQSIYYGTFNSGTNSIDWTNRPTVNPTDLTNLTETGLDYNWSNTNGNSGTYQFVSPNLEALPGWCI